MRLLAIHLAVCALAALAPLYPRARAAAPPLADFAWPATFEGRPLAPLPLGERDQRFSQDFPGRIGLFTDGARQIVLRFTTRATRRLHPASDCLRAVGYAILPLPARRTADGGTWSCFSARRATSALVVCEQIGDARGATWPEPSSWYWPALTGRSAGPWWSTTVFERAPGPLDAH
jgi:hypothetical protein